MNTDYRLTQLPNGATIATASMPHMESVSIGVWSAVGARHETARQKGIAHFTEHLLFKGTQKRSARRLITDVESVGGSVNAFTTHDHTCYYAKGPATKLNRLTDVLLDMYRCSTFPEPEINREREVIEEEIVMYREQPSQHVDDLLGATCWNKHPLGDLITGTPNSIARLHRPDFVNFTSRFYQARNTTIAVAGKIDHDNVVQRLAPALADMPHGQKPRFKKFEASKSFRGPRIHIETRPIEQTHLALAFHACHRRDPDRFALKVLNVILGENMSSRLFQQVREKRGFCYEINSTVHLLEDTGIWQLYAGLDTAKTIRALEIIWKELRRIATNPPSNKEVREAREYTIARSRVALESTSQQMMWTGESTLTFQEIVEPQSAWNQINRVTPEKIQKLAAKIFRPRRLSIALISPSLTQAEVQNTIHLP
ncbi:MAG: pitrilysin family protein [Verrucomicrobiota bacterium]